MPDDHEDDLRRRAEDGDPTAADEAGVRELADDELDAIAGGTGVEMHPPT